MENDQKIKIGIVGGTGYTGVELLRLLALHPQVELTAITSRGDAGLPVADMFPSLRGYVAVSYTHLDVYKRQHLLGQAIRREKGHLSILFPSCTVICKIA